MRNDLTPFANLVQTKFPLISFSVRPSLSFSLLACLKGAKIVLFCFILRATVLRSIYLEDSYVTS